MPRKSRATPTAAGQTGMTPPDATEEAIPPSGGGGTPSHGPSGPLGDADAADQTPATQPPADVTGRAPQAPESPRPVYAPDPRPVISIRLDDADGGPTAHLLRSHKFRQMQIRFDGGIPEARHRAELRRLGWRDRTEDEGVWTKQIDREARWQSVDRIEREFKEVANAIRREKGLEPALQGLTTA